MFDIIKDDYIASNKCVYGLAKAVMHYYKKSVEIQKKLIGDNINPYIFAKKSEKGIAYIDIEAIDKATAALRKRDWS